ncbi:MAG TPA: hypothetical protein PKC30_17040 [Saprospiraceae bacterium]|nr:hypothetical protein [Saprospiraceae bacterium]
MENQLQLRAMFCRINTYKIVFTLLICTLIKIGFSQHSINAKVISIKPFSKRSAYLIQDTLNPNNIISDRFFPCDGISKFNQDEIFYQPLIVDSQTALLFEKSIHYLMTDTLRRSTKYSNNKIKRCVRIFIGFKNTANDRYVLVQYVPLREFNKEKEDYLRGINLVPDANHKIWFAIMQINEYGLELKCTHPKELLIN